MATTHPRLHTGPAPRSRAPFLVPAFAFAAAALALGPRDAAAGCGCKKPPPPLAYLRPHFTYSGTPLDLFHAGLVEGGAYRVRFQSASGETASVVGTGFDRRDLADGQVKTHLRVAVPNLPLGPAAIEVFDDQQRLVFAVGDDEFTVVPSPVVLPDKPGIKSYDGQRAAIGRDGTVYLGIDLSAVKQAATLDIRARNLPLSFDALGVSFHNTQGFLMQLLDKPVAGMVTFDVTEGGKKDSTRLRYFRHEFETYFLAHGERETHAIDPTDPSWHLDGTPHIDHDHLIVAIRGLWKDGVMRAPGATEPFTLLLTPLPDDAAPLP